MPRGRTSERRALDPSRRGGIRMARARSDRTGWTGASHDAVLGRRMSAAPICSPASSGRETDRRRQPYQQARHGSQRGNTSSTGGTACSCARPAATEVFRAASHRHPPPDIGAAARRPRHRLYSQGSTATRCSLL